MKTQCISIRQNRVKTLGTLCLLMLFTFMTTALSAQNTQSTERTVTGVVKTYDGPLPFASVVLKGSMIGVTTEEDGSFTFPQKLKENDVLVISSLAYDSYELVIDSDTTFVQPYLEGSPIVIVGALRTKPSRCISSKTM